jgi:hypothetical protein
MIKVKFINPIIRLKGKTTIMSITCKLCIDKCVHKEKIFISKVTLKDDDKYDLNKARTILQTIIERKGYEWAYDIINKQRKVFYENYSECDDFCTKATHIIDHDEKYLETLISK